MSEQEAPMSREGKVTFADVEHTWYTWHDRAIWSKTEKKLICSPSCTACLFAALRKEIEALAEKWDVELDCRCAAELRALLGREK